MDSGLKKIKYIRKIWQEKLNSSYHTPKKSLKCRALKVTQKKYNWGFKKGNKKSLKTKKKALITWLLIECGYKPISYSYYAFVSLIGLRIQVNLYKVNLGGVYGRLQQQFPKR